MHLLFFNDFFNFFFVFKEGFNPSATTIDGRSPAQVADERRHTEIAQFLAAAVAR
jgi:hypothetical protein